MAAIIDLVFDDVTQTTDSKMHSPKAAKQDKQSQLHLHLRLGLSLVVYGNDGLFHRFIATRMIPHGVQSA